MNTGLLAGGAFAPEQAFWPKAKTLAQGQFICPEHVKSKGRRPPNAAGTHNKGHDQVVSFVVVTRRGFELVVTRRGFEPRTHCLKGSCSAN